MEIDEVNALLDQAKQGNRAALGKLLEHFRPYLRLLAQRDLDRRLNARLDASDVVQQTFLEAQRDLDAFRGEVTNELIGWLRKILANNVAQAVQHHLQTQKRSAHRERSMLNAEGELVPLAHSIPADQSTPSQRLMRGESAVRLALAIDRLPQDQQEAVRLRHLEGLTLLQISQRMERSETAVAGLIKRGLRGLRRQFGIE